MFLHMKPGQICLQSEITANVKESLAPSLYIMKERGPAKPSLTTDVWQALAVRQPTSNA